MHIVIAARLRQSAVCVVLLFVTLASKKSYRSNNIFELLDIEDYSNLEI